MLEYKKTIKTKTFAEQGKQVMKKQVLQSKERKSS